LTLTALGDEDAIIHLIIDGTPFVLDDEDLDEPIAVVNVTLATNLTMTWNSSIHVDTMGKGYEICFSAECPGSADPCDPYGEEEFARDCLEVDVYQFKEAFKIPLYRKWNLISLPLVPLVDPPIDPILDAYAFKSEILSVWYFDQCDDKWYVYPAGTPGADAELTDMEDGKGYWIRIKYDVANPAGTPLDGLWVWGTQKPVPPASPSAYPVCVGWNMIGFTSLGNMWDSVYLWNFPFPGAHGAVYGWWAPTQTWFALCHDAVVMWPGEGYWASFGVDGTIFPP
jgi:hypothetical protein